MTILFLTRLYLPHVGGVEKHIFEISKILSKQHKIIIVAEQDESFEPEHEQTKVAEVYRIPIGGVGESQKKMIIWKWLFSHLYLFKSADVVHIHDVFFWYLPFRFIFPFQKVFITFHGYEGSQPPRLNQLFWHRLAALLTSGNICIGDFHKKWYGINPSAVSYGAVSPVPIKKSLPQSESAIFIGRLAEDTGIMEYLAATDRLHLPMVVYGDGPLLSSAQAFVKKHGSQVKFYGFVPESANFLPDHKYAFVSRYLGILEALAAGIPIVAHYNNQIKRDYLSLAPFAGFIHVAGSVDQIVASVGQIRDNYPKSGVQAGRHWAGQQTWPKLAAVYTNLWTPTKLPLSPPSSTKPQP